MDGSQKNSRELFRERYETERSKLTGILVGRLETHIRQETEKYRAGQKSAVSKSLFGGALSCKMIVPEIQVRVYEERILNAFQPDELHLVTRLLPGPSEPAGGMVGLCFHMPDEACCDDFLASVNGSLAEKSAKAVFFLKDTQDPVLPTQAQRRVAHQVIDGFFGTKNGGTTGWKTDFSMFFTKCCGVRLFADLGKR